MTASFKSIIQELGKNLAGVLCEICAPTFHDIYKICY